MVYLADKAEFSVDMSKLSGPEAEGLLDRSEIGRGARDRAVCQQGHEGPFSTPAGWEDSLLVLEAAR